MKKALLIAFVTSLLLSCNNSAPPKEVAKEFVEAVYAANANKASALATEKTKAFVSEIKKQSPNNLAVESLSLATLTETISGNTAEVKNESINLTLEKENGDWKVIATPEAVAVITEKPEDLVQLKHKLESLLKEYKGRVSVASHFVDYKKSQGALSTPMQNLEKMVNKLNAITAWNKETITNYVQDQVELEALLDKAHEPTQTAHADMSMNYFLQLSQATDRIKAAQKDYNDAVTKTPSIMYPALAIR